MKKSAVLNALVFVLGVSVPASSLAHGEIENISCSNKALGAKVESTKISEKLVADLQLIQAGKSQVIAKGVQLKLEDKVKDQQVYENITFPIAGGSADLLVKEDYKLKVRKGKGTFKSAKLSLEGEFECDVEYEVEEKEGEKH